MDKDGFQPPITREELKESELQSNSHKNSIHIYSNYIHPNSLINQIHSNFNQIHPNEF